MGGGPGGGSSRTTAQMSELALSAASGLGAIITSNTSQKSKTKRVQKEALFPQRGGRGAAMRFS